MTRPLLWRCDRGFRYGVRWRGGHRLAEAGLENRRDRRGSVRRRAVVLQAGHNEPGADLPCRVLQHRGHAPVSGGVDDQVVLLQDGHSLRRREQQLHVGLDPGPVVRAVREGCTSTVCALSTPA
jgi:hypothetical protein